MQRRLALIVIVAFAVLAAGCNWPAVVPPGDAPLRYRDQVFTDVLKTSDITYGSATNLSGDNVTLKLDEYAPVGDTVNSRAAIVWVHGGSFRGGDKTSPELVDEANNFAKEGYVNFSINYRLETPGCSGDFSNCIQAITEAEQDAATAVKWVKAHASGYNVDPTRIAIGGSSAGAITALNVGYSRTEDPDAAVRAAVSLSGAHLAVNTIDSGDAPALLFHGTADPLVPYATATATVDQAQAAGIDVFLTTWEGDGHVPYVQHRQEILDKTRNFLWWEMDLANAAT
jgi:acetyl esterase/lipase